MLVVGVDPGIASCGIALVDTYERRVRLAKTFRTLAGRDTRARVAAVVDAVSTVIDDDVEGIAWERQDLAIVGQHRAGRTTHLSTQVLRIVGALEVLAMARGLRSAELTPQQVKLAVACKGNSSKGQVKASVSRLFTGCPARMSEHAADAIACAWAGAMRLQIGRK